MPATLDPQTAPATIDALPAIADEVSGAVPILMDGGIRRGSDIFKALARGADAVMVPHSPRPSRRRSPRCRPRHPNSPQRT